MAISVLVRNTFPITALKWADIPPKYIEVFKGGLQKHTPVGLVSSFRRRKRMPIVQCWNSSPNPSQRVHHHSLETRYVLPYWVGDRATTQKVLVGARSPSLKRVLLPSSSSSYHEMHSREVSKLKASLENANRLIEEQQIRKEECDQ
ncbi:NBS-LRR type resistance protein [Cucumis melo var. makuwa]|uniref:NBS-LRR type resistance protein n=1 Tax=Cucumis melo var. makuwa TaxID=1194695 RepID=A0A5D3BAC4_CUCMM|nr:NBS-LRR type resistance protein [Cucumis melo var. makuwa]TYJ95846.1 NBS-LRR type resistance protein [Cucumis melo var. makuwa]